jgi:hypothetical protein
LTEANVQGPEVAAAAAAAVTGAGIAGIAGTVSPAAGTSVSGAPAAVHGGEFATKVEARKAWEQQLKNKARAARAAEEAARAVPSLDHRQHPEELQRRMDLIRR